MQKQTNVQCENGVPCWLDNIGGQHHWIVGGQS